MALVKYIGLVIKFLRMEETPKATFDEQILQNNCCETLSIFSGCLPHIAKALGLLNATSFALNQHSTSLLLLRHSEVLRRIQTKVHGCFAITQHDNTPLPVHFVYPSNIDSLLSSCFVCHSDQVWLGRSQVWLGKNPVFPWLLHHLLVPYFAKATKDRRVQDDLGRSIWVYYDE